MTTRWAAAAALIVSLLGVLIILRNFRAGHYWLWMGGRRYEVTRDDEPLLFWVAIGGSTALIIGLIAVCLILLVVQP